MIQTLFKYIISASILTFGLLSHAADKCGAGQFSCNVSHTHSSTCCGASETCGVSDQGKAQCVIPLKEPASQTPQTSAAKSAAKKAVTKPAVK